MIASYGQNTRNQEAHQGCRQHQADHPHDADDRHEQVRQGSAARHRDQAYTEGVFNLVSELAETAGNLDHPLINGPDSGFKNDAKELTLLITSDRGLCGPYNGNILRTATNLFKKNPDTRAGDIELVGKKGEAFLKFNGIPVSSRTASGTPRRSRRLRSSPSHT